MNCVLCLLRFDPSTMMDTTPYRVGPGPQTSQMETVTTRSKRRILPCLNPKMPADSNPEDPSQAAVGCNIGHFLCDFWRRTRTLVAPQESKRSVRADSEFDDMDNPVYRRPKSLDHLVATTHFTRAEIKRLYRDFKAECPTGLIKEETFRNMYTQFFPKGANGSQYSHYVFNSLVPDQSGLLGFEELVLALSDLCRGPADKKLRWAFHIYDVDGDGVISRTELEDVALSINELTGECGNAGVDPVVSSATVRLWVDRIFQKMDLNDDGVISQEEFLAACLRDEEINRSLAMFDNVY